LGSRSARRGACTQPCRRAYFHDGERKPYFSAKDLELAPNIKDLIKLPVKALKIEGRMKDPSYVLKVVRAYRLLIDVDPSELDLALDYASKMLDEVPGRARASSFIEGVPTGSKDNLFTYEAVSGQYVGKIVSGKVGEYKVQLMHPLKKLDRLRVVDQYGNQGIPFKLTKMQVDDQEADHAKTGSNVTLFLPPKEGFQGYGKLYKVGSQEDEKKFLKHRLAKAVTSDSNKNNNSDNASNSKIINNINGISGIGNNNSVHKSNYMSDKSNYFHENVTDKTYKTTVKTDKNSKNFSSARFDNIPKKVFKVLRASGPKTVTLTPKDLGSRVWVWIDKIKDLYTGILGLSPQKIIVPFNETNSFYAERENLQSLKNKLVFSLPPLNFPPQDKILASKIEEFLNRRVLDFHEFMATNIGQIRLLLDLPHPIRVFTDNSIPILNHVAANALFEQGVSAVTLSEECDLDTFKFMNMSKLVGGKLLFYFSGKPSLITSRMRPSYKDDPFISGKGEIFKLIWHDEDYATLHPKIRYFFSSVFGKEISPDLIGFILDLRNEEEPLKLAEVLFEAIRKGETLKNLKLDFKTELPRSVNYDHKSL
jgi:hypothetical protein